MLKYSLMTIIFMVTVVPLMLHIVKKIIYRLKL